MGLINLVNEKPVHLVLAKDRVRSVKRGHPWIFPEVLKELPRAPAGSLALLKTPEGEILAKGFYDPASKLAFRTLALQKERLDEQLVEARLRRAAELRDLLFAPYDATNGYRLVNGEGDGLPGLVVDVYDSAAVVKLDGAGPESFYNADAIAAWLLARHPATLRTVFLKYRAGGPAGAAGAAAAAASGSQAPAGAGPSPKASASPSAAAAGRNGGGRKGKAAAGGEKGKAAAGAAAGEADADGGLEREVEREVEGRGRLLAGEAPVPGVPVRFRENGITFQADIVQGQKTGFFLDQRDNRALVGRLARGGRTVLNVFGYTGGFSVYAGVGGASHVTTVDVGRAALAYADANWALNGLPPARHTAAAEDAFAFLERAAAARDRWDVVIIDPPSFAPSKAAVPAALASYTRLFAAAAAVTAPHGTLALASCSSHVDAAAFMQVCEDALGRARRQGYLLAATGQPADHPSPAPAPELRYLKFAAYRLEG